MVSRTSIRDDSDSFTRDVISPDLGAGKSTPCVLLALISSL